LQRFADELFAANLYITRMFRLVLKRWLQ